MDRRSHPPLLALSVCSVTWHAAVWGGLTVLGIGLVKAGPVDLLGLGPAFLIIAGLLILGELRPVVTAGNPDPQGVVTSQAFVFAILFIWGLWPAVVAQGIAAVIGELSKRKTDWRLPFNVGQYVLSVLAAWGAMAAFGLTPSIDAPQSDFSGSHLPVLVLSWLVWFVVNDALVAGMFVRPGGTTFREAFLEDLSYYVLTSFAVLALSPLIAIVAIQSWTYVPLLILPMFTVYKTASISREKEHQAHHDGLTALPNRKLLHQRMDEEMTAAARREERGTALLFVDLDRFKDVNDTLGHQTGDDLLRLVAARISAIVRPGDTVARLGGDEFAVLLPDVTDAAVAVEVAERIREAVTRPFELEGLLLDLDASIGIAVQNADASSPEQLMRAADVAMYHAKEHRVGIAIYDTDLDPNSSERLALAGDLRRGIARGELELHYQPLIGATGQVQGVEALVRWRRSEDVLIMPDVLLPVADRAGLLPALTAAVLATALRQASDWWERGMRIPIAINVSADDLVDPDFPQAVVRGLREYDLPPAALRLEITEHALVADFERFGETLRWIADLGVEFSLDDFGTGYSSLLHLRHLPLARLKIDRSFVSTMLENQADAVVVASTIHLAHALGHEVVAEGVETAETWDRLIELGCDVGQGWLFSRPMPAAAAEPWLASALERAGGPAALSSA